MTTDLDKYGLVALTIIVVLILFIAVHDLQEEPDPDIRRVQIEDEGIGGLDKGASEDLVVVLEGNVEEPGAEDFNFMEGPVEYPGSPALEKKKDGPSKAGVNRHKVKRGDTLSEISILYYGSARHWEALVEANPGVNPKSLMVGQELKIPALPLSVPLRSVQFENPSSPKQNPARFYSVKKGDTLVKIAEKVYGDGMDWRKIYAANRKSITDPRKLKIGTKLEIPRPK